MEQNSNQSSTILEHENELIQLLLDLIIGLMEVKDEIDIDCRNLAAKIAYHAISIENMGSGISTDFTQFSSNEFVDVPSILVLTRTVFENYLLLYEICFDEINPDKRKYHYWVSRHKSYLSIKADLEERLNDDNTGSKDIEKIRQDLKFLVEDNKSEVRIKETLHYASLTKKQQDKTLKRADIYPILDKRERATSAGISYQKMD